MKNSILFILFGLMMIAGCNDNSIQKVEEDGTSIKTATPEVLKKGTLSRNTSDLFNSESYSYRGYDDDIVSILYKEALQKSAELNALNDKIISLEEDRSDSLKLYERYSEINRKYWENARNQINQLSDTVLRKSSHDFFEKMEADYNSSVSVHEAKKDSIVRRVYSLEDQLILLKLSVSSSMIKNYQSNEMPDIEQMENIIREYDNMIEVTKEYIQRNK